MCPLKDHKGKYSSPEFWRGYYKTLVEPKSVNPDCVDGRAWEATGSIPELAPQALGGSLHFAVLKCLADKNPLDLKNIKVVLEELSEKGFALGLHIDDHSKHDPEKSGCGFADNLPAILKNIVNLKDDITTTLTQPQILEALRLTEEEVKKQMGSLVERTQTLLAKIQEIVYGENLIGGLQKDSDLREKLVVYELKGDHAEKIALVNLQEKTTFDTIKADKEGNQAFNLDLWYILRISESLKIDRNFTKVSSLALYLATERTLRKDKTPLPVVIIKY